MLTPRKHQKLQAFIHDIDVGPTAAAFDALSEPNRCLIFRALLKTKKLGVGELASIVGISDPLASQHLKILLHANLVRNEKSGKFVYYCINDSSSLVLALQKAVED
jgi:ArsR family transcriptional regulator